MSAQQTPALTSCCFEKFSNEHFFFLQHRVQTPFIRLLFNFCVKDQRAQIKNIIAQQKRAEMKWRTVSCLAIFPCVFMN